MKGDPQDWLRVQWRLREQNEFREAVCSWLKLNGVDPADVPIESRASIADGMLTLDVYKRSTSGRLQLDPANPDRLWSETLTVPVKVPPTFEAQDWLRP